MMKPTWLDRKYDHAFEKATAEQALLSLAKDDRVIDAVREALKDHDAHPGRPGGSRVQVIRSALAEVLQSED